MTVRSTHELGKAIARRRRELGLSQAEAADLAGVSRVWIGKLEAGRSTVEIGRVLRTIAALGLGVSLVEPELMDRDPIDDLIDGGDDLWS